MPAKRSTPNGKLRSSPNVQSSPLEAALSDAFGELNGPVCLDSADDALIGRFVKLILNARGYCGFGARADSDTVSVNLTVGQFKRSVWVVDTKHFEGVVSTCHRAIRLSGGNGD
jgi:hypothetical protein